MYGFHSKTMIDYFAFVLAFYLEYEYGYGTEGHIIMSSPAFLLVFYPSAEKIILISKKIKPGIYNELGGGSRGNNIYTVCSVWNSASYIHQSFTIILLSNIESAVPLKQYTCH